MSTDTTQSGKLILDGVTFILDDCSNTRLYIFESDEYEGKITIGFDVWFLKERYHNEMVSPVICIHSHETGKTKAEEIIGCTYYVDDVKESFKREDTLYVFEHEPMEKYSFTVVETANKMDHIQIEGIAIVDGYANPYKTAPFSEDFWLHY